MTANDNGAVVFDSALNMARQSLYRFAALSLLDPKCDSWECLHALRSDPILIEASAFIRQTPQAIPDQLGLGESPLDDLVPQRVLECLPDSSQALNAEYESTFGLLVSNACPPYETEYIDGKLTFQRSNEMADVSGFYHAFGLTISKQHPERHDHIVLELEFMAFLLGLERRAFEEGESGSPEKLAVCRDAQQKFFKEHVAWWVPAFGRLLAKENQGGFYEAVAHYLAALLPAERALLGVEVPSRLCAPSTLERPEECEGCELASH